MAALEFLKLFLSSKVYLNHPTFPILSFRLATVGSGSAYFKEFTAKNSWEGVQVSKTTMVEKIFENFPQI